ncbi:hypothetical protein B0H16DRAFT_1311208, partial [Mycena metata]
LFSSGTPKLVILGAGGMGKTTLARVIVHHPTISETYKQNRFFIACDSTSSKAELAALIGVHLELKPTQDPTQSILKYLSRSPPTLLILDNFETVWEPTKGRGDVEEFLSHLTDVESLALMITMRGAERPAKVHWTRPFLPPLTPLSQNAARRVFVDIADDHHDTREVDQVLQLTDNMPLAINLLASLADSEGCSEVLSRWTREKTTTISEGYDKRNNLETSIKLSLASSRIMSQPQSLDLLSILAIQPDGLSDVELLQGGLPLDNILACKGALLRTALAYRNENRLKVLVPIREYMQKFFPAKDCLIQPLHNHFHELLGVYTGHAGNPSSLQVVPRISSNYANIQCILENSLQTDFNLVSAISVCYLNQFSVTTNRGMIPMIYKIFQNLSHSTDHRLRASLYTELINCWRYNPKLNTGKLIIQALKHLSDFDDTDLECMFRKPLLFNLANISPRQVLQHFSILLFGA